MCEELCSVECGRCGLMVERATAMEVSIASYALGWADVYGIAVCGACMPAIEEPDDTGEGNMFNIAMLNLKQTEQAMRQSVYLECDGCSASLHMPDLLTLAIKAWDAGYVIRSDEKVLCHLCYAAEGDGE